MKHRISPAVAISLAALFFSLTGAGFAASRYIITSKSQTKPSVLRALKGERGPRGLTGANGQQGLQGAQGVAGQPGATGSSVPLDWTNNVTFSAVDTLSSDFPAAEAVASCPEGEQVVNGGFIGSHDIATTNSPIFPNTHPSHPSQWRVTARWDGVSSGEVEAWVICA